MISAVVAGLLLGGSLIVAIGAQNAFVIREGASGRPIFWICLFCAASDAILIWAGVLGLGVVLKQVPAFIPVMTWGGAVFLVWYGMTALRRAFSPSAMATAEGEAKGLAAALLTCAAFTWLNPHVYLDTVVLVGSIANARPPGEQAPFALGASLASLVWFFLIGYGAAALRPWLARPAVWRVIDGTIAVIMFVLAGKLVLG
jgi:L-lysine exporter family protein LysE/ArgO